MEPELENVKGQIIELSEAELEAFSGGQVDVSFTLLLAEDSSAFATDRSGNHSSSVSSVSRRSLFGLHISGTFESMGHFSAFLSRITSFFGKR